MCLAVPILPHAFWIVAGERVPTVLAWLHCMTSRKAVTLLPAGEYVQPRRPAIRARCFLVATPLPAGEDMQLMLDAAMRVLGETPLPAGE